MIESDFRHCAGLSRAPEAIASGGLEAWPGRGIVDLSGGSKRRAQSRGVT